MRRAIITSVRMFILVTCATFISIDAGAQVVDADFNGDGIADMAVGVPNDTVSGMLGAGAVNVFYGSANGLSAQGDQIWSQDSTGIANAADINEHFGAAICAGYFNDDIYCDLAISVPNQTISGEARAGAVHVIYGSANGLDSSGDQFWNGNVGNIIDVAEAGGDGLE